MCHKKLSMNLLYYPYINLPNGPWMSKATLYFDDIKIISTPYIDGQNNSFNQYNEILRAEGILSSVYPLETLTNIPLFESKVIIEIDKLKRVKRTNEKKVRIHRDKFSDQIFRYLEKEKYIENAYDQWAQIPISISEVLMTKLAEEISLETNSIPSTDRNGYSKNETSRRTNRINRKRNILLSKVLPNPIGIPPAQIVKFKSQNEQLLSGFRDFVYLKTLELMSCRSKSEEEELSQSIYKEIEEGKTEIKAKMDENKMKRIKEDHWLTIFQSLFFSAISSSPLPIVSGIMTAAKTETEKGKRKLQPKLKYLVMLENEIDKYDT